MKKPAGKTKTKILAANEPSPFKVINPTGSGSGLIICDHSSKRVPRALKGMAIKKSDLDRHIGWDIGTEDIGRHLSKVLDMPMVLAGYSRLVVDLNRAPDHAECMVEESDHTKIPANAGLSKKLKEQRLKEIFWPYHNQITKQVDRFVKKRQTPLLLAIHSFTPEMNNAKRPWHIAVLWNKQEKIAKKLITAIRKNNPGLLVGENEPYTLKNERFKGSTIWRHAEQRDLPYVFVEFRQDLVDTKEKAVQWAEMFIQALQPVFESLAAKPARCKK
ncbi:MAG: N-formylglutamate amidohydrolase [Alphaproteobacteria bacterium]|nr:N-formylglutamate amidohydrolase [Alphaproteobacteria bacterium]